MTPTPLIVEEPFQMNLEGLEGRPFEWGRFDCFSLARDFYTQNFGITVTNFARPNFWESDILDLILTGFAREGFDQLTSWKLDDLRPGDVMCMCVNESKPNHFGVYIGNNEFIHHLNGNFSSVSPLKGHWLHYTSFLLRHPDVPDLRPTPTSVGIEELLRARYSDKASSSA